jgi:vacuolar-type H+-ATPase subunit I/STV1
MPYFFWPDVLKCKKSRKREWFSKPPKGETTMPDPNGTPDKEKWEEAGFADEAAMIEAAKAAADLRSQIAKAEDDLKKEREAKGKTDSQFMKQAQEIGDLRKKLKEVEKPPEKTDDKANGKGNEQSDDELLESMSAEESTRMDKALDDPKNVELKKRVALGGIAAMAEFVRSYRAEAPVDLTAPLFGSRKKKSVETVDVSSIKSAVQALFKQHNESEKNNLAVSPTGGAQPNAAAKTTRQVQVGGVDAEFFIKKKE